ncbi:MAG TPA: RNA polymerase sigma factor [Planctomycetota bacterium]|nr:RNA polymerase sigma factor [Planctomycetota bacterium]
MDQAELIERLRKGDTDAFAELVTTYEETVRSFTAIWSPSRDEADDIAQEVFLAAFRGIHTFEPGKDLKTWLLGISRNLTRNAWRRVSRTSGRHSRTDVHEILERQAVAFFQKRECNMGQREDALRQCMETLPANTKNIFTRYFVDEVSSSELASTLNTTENTVRATLSRIRRALRSCIERRIATESGV